MLPQLTQINRLITRMLQKGEWPQNLQYKCQELNDSLLNFILSLPDKERQVAFYESAIEDYISIFQFATTRLEEDKCDVDFGTDIRYVIARGYHDLEIECKRQGIYCSKELMDSMSSKRIWPEFVKVLCSILFEDKVEKHGAKFLQFCLSDPDFLDFMDKHKNLDKHPSMEYFKLFPLADKDTSKGKENPSNIDSAKKPKGKSNKKQKIEDEKYPTLNYVCNSDDRQRRIDIVMRLMVAWRMIVDPYDVNDFNALFSGSYKRLNITWHKDTNTAVLYALLQKLLEHESFIKKLKKGSAKAVARNILRGKDPSGDKNRLCEEDNRKISILVFALNPSKPLLQLQKSSVNFADQLSDYDINYLSEQLAKEGQLSITKDLNKYTDS